MREVTVAATQMACLEDTRANINKAKDLIRKCASEGAQIILIQELLKVVVVFTVLLSNNLIFD